MSRNSAIWWNSWLICWRIIWHRDDDLLFFCRNGASIADTSVDSAKLAPIPTQEIQKGIQKCAKNNYETLLRVFVIFGNEKIGEAVKIAKKLDGFLFRAWFHINGKRSVIRPTNLIVLGLFIKQQINDFKWAIFRIDASKRLIYSLVHALTHFEKFQR